MSNQVPEPSGIRASDAEREQFARTIQEAAAQGRLTVPEADDRLAGVFAARYREELPPLVADLPVDGAAERSRPAPVGWRGRLPAPLAVHAALVVLWSTVLITRWVAGGAGFFWPAFPMFWLGLSLVVHAVIRARRAEAARGE